MPARLVRKEAPGPRAAAWEISGPPGAPVIVVLGGISAHRHVTSTTSDPSPGWWQELVGPGSAIDTSRYRALGIDWAAHEGVTTRDQADRLAAALDDLGVARVEAIVGASYGGMVALAFGAAYRSRVGRLVLISGAHETHPMATAHRVIQRRIIRLGLAAGTPTEGLALARALGVTTYRTAAEFAGRFDVAPERIGDRERFPVEGYLDHCGQRFAANWKAERYLALSESLDLHRVDPATVTVPTALLGIREDTLVPTWQLWELASRLGAVSRVEEISSIYGHDAFLKEVDAVGTFLSEAVNGEVSRAA
ncbi:MAG TPA: homoserine O-succinyltransferase [Gemmatimonadales bacterium]|nr:homoserine O-succinyltransferase [Gemmatimonadales bacterium]